MNADYVERLRSLMQPELLDVCLLCGGPKGVGYLTCGYCREICPDPDCRGNGWKGAGYYQCSNCYEWLRGQPRGRPWSVYVCDDGYVGMTSDLDARDEDHQWEAGAPIVWWTPLEFELDVREAFKLEWALKHMLRLADDGHPYAASRIDAISSHTEHCGFY